MKNLSSVQVLIIHLIVAAFLAYLAYMVLNKKQIPNAVGVLLAFLAAGVVAVHIYFYWDHTQKKARSPKY